MTAPTPQASASATGRALLLQGNEVVHVDAATARGAIGPIPASEITNTPAGNIAATNVQTALNELDARVGIGPIPASEITNTPAGNITATNVQAALNELDTEKVKIADVRERLTANRTYYVRTDGSNSNNGLSNTAGGAFLTVQRAVDVILATLDLAGFNIEIQVADGTYTGATTVSTPQVGAGLITIRGNATTPSNVVLQFTAASDTAVVTAKNAAVLSVKDVKLVNTGGVGAAPLLLASKGGVITFQNIDCGQAVQQLRAEDGGRLECIGNYVISAGAASHWVVVNAQIRVQSKTITIVGTPAFTTFFADAARIGLMLVNANTFSGSATGARYSIVENSVIMTGGAGATYLPGNAAGSTATGGQYI
jgi:hypothetical protein